MQTVCYRYAPKSVSSLRSKKKLGWFFCEGRFVFNAVFSLQAPLSCGRLVTASPKTPARLARFPLKPTPMQEGWRLGFFANKATDG